MLAVFHGSSRAQPFPAWDVLTKQSAWLTAAVGVDWFGPLVTPQLHLLMTDRAVWQDTGQMGFLRVCEAASSVNDVNAFADMSAHADAQ